MVKVAFRHAVIKEIDIEFPLFADDGDDGWESWSRIDFDPHRKGNQFLFTHIAKYDREDVSFSFSRSSYVSLDAITTSLDGWHNKPDAYRRAVQELRKVLPELPEFGAVDTGVRTADAVPALLPITEPVIRD